MKYNELLGVNFLFFDLISDCIRINRSNICGCPGKYKLWCIFSGALVEYFFFRNTLEMAVSGNLEALKLKIFLARRQPWWRLVRFAPSPPLYIRNVPTPLYLLDQYGDLAYHSTLQHALESYYGSLIILFWFYSLWKSYCMPFLANMH